MKTALADELHDQIVPAPKYKNAANTTAPDDRPPSDQLAEIPHGSEYELVKGKEREGAYGTPRQDPLIDDAVQAIDHQIDANRVVRRVLETIPTYKKRLAYYLYLHNVPRKSEHGPSIAKACGVSERTIRLWIKEIEDNLKQNEEVLTLLKSIS